MSGCIARVGRVGARLDLDAVAHAVAVRVDVHVLAAVRHLLIRQRAVLELVAVGDAVAVAVIAGVRRVETVRGEVLVRDAVAVSVRVEVGIGGVADVLPVAVGLAGARGGRAAVAVAVVAAAAGATAGEAGAAAGRAGDRKGHVEAEIAGRGDAEAEPAKAARSGGAGRTVGVRLADAERRRAGELEGLAAVLLGRGGEAVPVGHGREQRAADQDRRDEASRDRAREPQVAGVRSAPLRGGAATTDAVIRHSSSSPIQPAHRRNPCRAEELWTRSGRLFDADRRVSEDLAQTLNR